jgi:hypothetical protein
VITVVIFAAKNSRNFWRKTAFITEGLLLIIQPPIDVLAERAVQTFKEAMKKMSNKESLETKVSRFLFKYRITPHSTTGIAPAEMLMSRKPISRLDVLHPDVRQRVQNQQKKQKELHDQHAVDRQLRPGDLVYLREFGKQQKWCPGVINTQTGPVSYTIQLEDDREVHRHQDQVIQRETPEENENEVIDPDLNQQPVPDQQVVSEENAVPAARYPQRDRHTPDYYS